jgi:hypothetical protein
VFLGNPESFPIPMKARSHHCLSLEEVPSTHSLPLNDGGPVRTTWLDGHYGNRASGGRTGPGGIPSGVITPKHGTGPPQVEKNVLYALQRTQSLSGNSSFPSLN